MVVYTELLACKEISERAREELNRAACMIHKEVPGLPSDIEIVELQHAGARDRSGMHVWDVPLEIQIRSRELYLSYNWKDEMQGYKLSWLGEEIRPALPPGEANETLGDLEEHPF